MMQLLTFNSIDRVHLLCIHVHVFILVMHCNDGVQLLSLALAVISKQNNDVYRALYLDEWEFNNYYHSFIH